MMQELFFYTYCSRALSKFIVILVQGAGSFFLLLFCGCVCACSFLNWCGAGGSACAVFCNLILISCRAFVVFYMFFDRVCETAPALALLSLPHT